MWLLRKLFPDWPDAQLMVLRMLLNSPDSAFTCLAMSKDEMEMIRDLDIDVLKRHQHRIHMYFAEVDDWVGDNKAAILREFAADEENVRVVHGREGIPHSFCISECTVLFVRDSSDIQPKITAKNWRSKVSSG